ncbi:MAG: hypothetical protein QXD04_00760 [Candidatus Bathyarchaeia archaeon]
MRISARHLGSSSFKGVDRPNSTRVFIQISSSGNIIKGLEANLSRMGSPDGFSPALRDAFLKPKRRSLSSTLKWG